MLSETRKSALRTLVLSTLDGETGGKSFADLFLISGAEPSELKMTLFKLELEGLIEEPVANFYKKREGKKG